MISIWIHHMRNCPEAVQGCDPVMEQMAEEWWYIIRGQRGVGVYDVAFEGLIRNVERRYRETGSDTTKQEYETFMRITPCKACHGQRLKKESLAVTVADKNIHEITSNVH